MGLVNTKEMLSKAKKEGYGVGAFNVTTLEMIRGVIQAAEAEKSPVILQFAEGHEAYVPLNCIGEIMVREAKQACVPVAVHFDHGETFEKIVEAMHLGFSSVMMDASRDSFEENIRKTQEIVRIANVLNVSVEAELGRMNRESGIVNDHSVQYEDISETFTMPAYAKEFEQKTGIDMLAVAFGTVHGVYTQTPKLDFERLHELSKITTVPLVMHGGSGLTKEEYQKVVSLGISKINYYSTMAYDTAMAMKEKLNQETNKVFISDVAQWSQTYIHQEVAACMQLFGSSGKA